MSRHVTLLVALAAAALVATPALAAHKFSCYDLAWQSQDMKSCLANPQQWEKTHHMHKPMKAKAKGKAVKSAKAKAEKKKPQEMKQDDMKNMPMPNKS
jgi:hypothetical protein